MKHNFVSFCSNLNESVVSEINEWSNVPELKKLLLTLKSINEPQLFLDHYAEAMIARFFLKSGYLLSVEYPTINGRHADFRAYKGDLSFFVHIKRLNTEGKTQKQMNIQSRLKMLEKIKKPFVVSVIFYRDLTNLEMQYFCDSLTNFIMQASIGSFIEIEKYGDVLGECKICCPNSKGHVLFIQSSSMMVVEEKNRFYKKLSDAYKQFMPNEINLVFMSSPWPDDIEDYETALLGESYVDYTIVPPKILRKNNGFWSNGKHPESYISVWFNFGLKEDYINFITWHRENYKVQEFVSNLFPSHSQWAKT